MGAVGSAVLPWILKDDGSKTGNKKRREAKLAAAAAREQSRQEANARATRGGYAPGSAILPGTGGAGSGLIR
jgi:hypothetical protein